MATNDRGLCALLAGVVVVYLWFWPRDFYAFDEGLFLYESKRLLDGDVFYRDIFEILTPGAFYVMALFFRVFGTTIATAKTVMAIVHASIAVLIYLIARRAGTRRSLALTAGFAHLPLSFVAMPMANPHWFGTLLTLLVAYLCLGVDRTSPGKGALRVGLANGALVMVQQQKGAVIAAGVAAVLVVDHLLAPRRHARAFRSLVVSLGLFGAGIAIVAMPSTLALLWAAGLRPLWEALIHFPLRNYSGFRQCRVWGSAGFFPTKDRLVFPRLIAVLPYVVILLPLRVAWSWLVQNDVRAARPVIVLSLLLSAATLSVYYCPNFTHLSLVAPLAFPLLAEAAEAVLAAAGSRLPALSAVAAIVLSGVVLLRLGAIALETLQGRAKLYSLSHQTAAGVVDFRNPAEIKLLEAVVERTGPGDELFAYPSYPGIYFLSGTKNPTRFQILLRNYHEPTHFQEAIDVLEKRRVRFVVLQPFGTWPKKDPFVQYLRRAYTSVRVPFSRRFPGFALLERKDGAASSAPLSPLGDPPPMD